MPKDRDQLTPDEPEDWSELQTHRGQGTGGSGYDRVAGETSRPPLHDESAAEETVPDPIPDDEV
jgi:hypothetical protein